MDFEKKPEADFAEKKWGEWAEVDVNVKVDLQEIIDAIVSLDTADQEKVYEALTKSLGKSPSGEPKKEEPKKDKAPEGEMNAQDLAKTFM